LTPTSVARHKLHQQIQVFMARRIITLLSVASLAFAAATVSAQSPVFSVNSVGYVKRDLVAGFTMFSNPLNVTSNGVPNNTLNALIPSAPDGAIVYRFSNGSYSILGEYFQGFGWSPNGSLQPGQGAWIFVPQATSVVFSGEVLQGSLTNPLPSGYSMVSSQVPQAASLTALGFPAQDGDMVFIFNPQTQSYNGGLFSFDGVGWSPGSVQGPIIPAGGSFWVLNTGAARNWNRNFSVNP